MRGVYPGAPTSFWLSSKIYICFRDGQGFLSRALCVKRCIRTSRDTPASAFLLRLFTLGFVEMGVRAKAVVYNIGSVARLHDGGSG